MSIYSNVDLIKQFLKSRAPSDVSIKPTRIDRKARIISSIVQADSLQVPALNPHEKKFFQSILDSLNALGKINNPEQQRAGTREVLSTLNQYDQSKLSGSGLKIVKHVAEDLHIIVNGKATVHLPLITRTPEQQLIIERYSRLLNSPFLLRSLQQGSMAELGNYGGYCYGFTRSMADSDLSPYKNSAIDQIKLTKTIHKYQKNQLNPNKSQRVIKSTRLTTYRFCPSVKEQAQELYAIASEHRGVDLAVSLDKRHSTYLSLQTDGKIRYTDSNHGVFLFDTKEQFITAYRLIYQLEHSVALKDKAYLSYEVSKMIEDKNNSLKVEKTWSGLLRSLLTGTKYRENTLSNLLDPGLLLISCTIVGAAVGSFIPVIGTLVGLVVGATVGALAGVSSMLISQSHYSGILSPYHIIRDKLHHFAEFIKNKLGMSHECDNPIEVPDVESLSTSHLKMTGMGLTPEEPTVVSTTASIAEPINNKTGQILNVLSESEPPEQLDNSSNYAIGLK